MKHACATRRSSDLPWRADVYGGGVRPPEVFILDADGKEIALVYATDGADEPTAFPAVANSRLMVEAPAMKATIGALARRLLARSEEHTSELQSLMRNSYAVFCLHNKKQIYT